MYLGFLYYQPSPVINGKPAVVMHRAAFEQGHANQMAALKAADDEEQSMLIRLEPNGFTDNQRVNDDNQA